MSTETSTSTPDNNFYIGLCMAGAVSAGAYTAGVVDYLIEALQEWQNRKDAGTPGTPSHNVVIPVIGGASAGGMTGIITAAALNNPIIPIKEPSQDILAERPENKLYHAWVDLLEPDMFPLLLKTNDIKNNEIISLLNSEFIDKLAERSLKVDKSAWQKTPPFFDEKLKVFSTLTNLQGFRYNIAFNTNISANNKYYMAIHNDYACFKMYSSSEEEDGWMHLDFKNNKNSDIAKDAAMATGAFPIGLQSRLLKRTSNHVNKIPFCVDITKDNPVEGTECETLNVDGGVINNEPFEKVREVLREITDQKDSQEYQHFNTFKSTVLMVDPFPSGKPGRFKSSQKLFKVIGLTFSAILQQMRAKPVDLSHAMDSEKAGQFLIAPSRARPVINSEKPEDIGKMQEVAGDRAIACGSFDGFGGFISKEFRVHDYFLGRFNCEVFLRNYFTIPAQSLEKNEIFKKGYEGIDTKQFMSKDGKIQIIPIFSPRPADNYFPIPTFSNGSNWPVIEEKKIDKLKPLVTRRVQALVLNSVPVKGINKFLLWIGAKVILNKVFTTAAMKSIKGALTKHQLMKEGKVK